MDEGESRAGSSGFGHSFRPATTPRRRCFCRCRLQAPYDYALARRRASPGAAMLVRGAAWAGAACRRGVGKGAKARVAPEKLQRADAAGRYRLPEALCDFIDWVARYTLSPPGAVLAQALARAGRVRAGKPSPRADARQCVPERMTPARARVLALDGGRARAHAAAESPNDAGVGRGRGAQSLRDAGRAPLGGTPGIRALSRSPIPSSTR